MYKSNCVNSRVHAVETWCGAPVCPSCLNFLFVHAATGTCNVTLKSAIDSFCGELNLITSVPPSPIHRITWTSIPKQRFATNYLRQVGTYSYVLPSAIPSNANNIQMFVFAGLGPSNTAAWAQESLITIYTLDGSDKHYNNYMSVMAWRDTWRVQTENMWFPMPANRRIFIKVGTAINIGGGFYIDAIGYN